MQVQNDIDLQPLNTLAVPARAQHFLSVHNLAQLHAARDWAAQAKCAIHIIGGGSNLVLGAQVMGLTLQMQLKGREVVARSGDQTLLRVGAGENWHEFVSWCLHHHLYGLENLALIPGTVGASPVQNIGAYGVEVAQVIEQVEGIDLDSGEPFALSAQDCCFGYRDSIFKRAGNERRVITHVLFRLSAKSAVNLEYPALAAELGGEEPTPRNVFAAVCRIRSSKLPDPASIPNCGSFFKNPVVTECLFRNLSAAHPAMPSFAVAVPTPDAYRKLAAAWLIDQCGWKGRSRYGVAVHHAQALVLTNINRCGSESVLALARDIQAEVMQRFNVVLELEPKLIGQS